MQQETKLASEPSLSVRLRNMRFHAFHGVLPEERIKGGAFTVSIAMQLKSALAAQTDDLADTVNYAEVYELVAREMQQPSNLIEHVCGRIARAVLEAFPKVRTLSVTVRKDVPPIPGMEADGAEAELTLSR